MDLEINSELNLKMDLESKLKWIECKHRITLYAEQGRDYSSFKVVFEHRET